MANFTGDGASYFVSNIFVEKVFDQIAAKQYTIEKRFEGKLAILSEKIDNVIDIREKELPYFEMRLGFTNRRMNKLSHFLVR